MKPNSNEIQKTSPKPSQNFPKTLRKFSENNPESFFQSPSIQPTHNHCSELESEPTESSTPLKPSKFFQDFSQKSFNERLQLLKNTPLPQTSPNFLKHCKKSPMRGIRNRFSLELNHSTKLQFPSSGEFVYDFYSHLLSEQEKQEISEYPEIYFIGEYIKKNHGKLQEEDGGYKANPGDQIVFRYEILELLGKGSFGKVFKCFDHKRQMEVAIKVLNKTMRMKILAETETKVLRKLNESDPDDSKCIVRMLSFFEYRGHIHIVFELLATSLFNFIRGSYPNGLDLQQVKRISSQILIALSSIHRQGIIHRDLKLENILLKHQSKTTIKIIDFGSASLFPCPFYSYVQSRYYRAPEVILGNGHTNKIDIWSFGCIVVELITGRSLFTGKNQEDQIMKIALIMGSPPDSLIEKSRKKYNNIEKYMESKSRHSGKLQFLLPDDDPNLIEFLNGCLQWDPEARFSAEEALKHPWIKHQGKKELDRKYSD